MNGKRVRISIKHLLVLTFLVASLCAFLVAFGPHLFWASKHAIAHNCAAMTEVQLETGTLAEGTTSCSFDGLRFDIPTRLFDSAKVVRATPTSLWLTFEDATRLLQIPLSNPDVRANLTDPPPALAGRSLPSLMESIVAASSSDFSLGLSHAELRTHDWAISNREIINLDVQSMDRYARLSTETLDAILISADPRTIDSKSRVRSILVWEPTARDRTGTIWFGDSTTEEVHWIHAVAKGLDVIAATDASSRDYSELTDAEILSLLNVE